MARLPITVRCLVAAAVLSVSAGCLGSGNNGSPFADRYPLGELAEATVQDGPAAEPREPAKVWLDRYVVEPGDSLLIVPTELDSKIRISADQTVLPDGNIDLGKYGMMQAAGKTVMEIERDVMAAVTKKEKEKDKDDMVIGFIDVRLVNRQSKAFYVIGEVTTPGRYVLTGNECVLDAILLAGGLSDRASWLNILLVRPCGDGPGQVLKVNYGDIVRVGAGATNYQLQPGDRVYVSTRSGFNAFFNCDRLR